MTNNTARQQVFTTMEAQRHQAAQAAREQPELDPRSVLLVAQRLIDEGDRAGAESIVKAWRESRRAA